MVVAVVIGVLSISKVESWDYLALYVVCTTLYYIYVLLEINLNKTFTEVSEKSKKFLQTPILKLNLRMGLVRTANFFDIVHLVV